MTNFKMIAATLATTVALAASPVSAKGIAPLVGGCGPSVTKGYAACPATRIRAVVRADRTRFTAASVSAAGKRQLDQLIASLN